MTAETDRELTGEIAGLRGEFVAFLRQYGDDSTRISNQLALLSAQVGTMATSGCALGKQHESAITKLEGRPEKTIALVGGAVGILGGIAGVFAIFWP